MKTLTIKYKYRLIFVIGLSISAAAAEDKTSLYNFEGYYTAPSPLCTDRAATTGADCDRPNHGDCVLIKRLDHIHAEVSAFSAQDNGQICGFSGVSILTHRGLEYTGTKDDGRDQNKQLIMKIANGRLTLTYLEQVKPGDFAPFCASHASFDRISFPWATRQSAIGRECAPF